MARRGLRRTRSDVARILFTDEELTSVERGAAMLTPAEEQAVASQLRNARAFLRYVVDARTRRDRSVGDEMQERAADVEVASPSPHEGQCRD